MNLSEHFTLEEATFSATAVRRGLDNNPSTLQLANMKVAASKLEAVYGITGTLHINSWLRLPAVNMAAGGSKMSSHMDGWAIDVSCKKMTPYQLCQKVKKAGIKFDQMIHEFGSWMHISFAPEMRQQELTIFRPENKYKAGILTKEQYSSS